MFVRDYEGVKITHIFNFNASIIFFIFKRFPSFDDFKRRAKRLFLLVQIGLVIINIYIIQSEHLDASAVYLNFFRLNS